MPLFIFTMTILWCTSKSVIMFNSRIEIPNTFYYFRNLKIRLRCDRNFVIIKSWDKTINRTEDQRVKRIWIEATEGKTYKETRNFSKMHLSTSFMILILSISSKTFFSFLTTLTIIFLDRSCVSNFFREIFDEYTH